MFLETWRLLGCVQRRIRSQLSCARLVDFYIKPQALLQHIGKHIIFLSFFNLFSLLLKQNIQGVFFNIAWIFLKEHRHFLKRIQRFNSWFKEKFNYVFAYWNVGNYRFRSEFLKFKSLRNILVIFCFIRRK